MKTINEEEVLITLVSVEMLYRGEFRGFSIGEQDSIQDQLLIMKIFLVELAHKLRERKEFDVNFAHKKLSVLKEYLNDLEIIVKEKDKEYQPDIPQNNPYASYSIHNEN